MDEREELRRLISIIEQGSGTESVAQAIDDIRVFTSAANSIATRLDARMKNNDSADTDDTKKSKRKIKPNTRGSAGLPTPPPLQIPKAQRSQHGTGKRASSGAGRSTSNASGVPKANAAATSQADYDRLKPKQPISTVSGILRQQI